MHLDSPAASAARAGEGGNPANLPLFSDGGCGPGGRGGNGYTEYSREHVKFRPGGRGRQ